MKKSKYPAWLDDLKVGDKVWIAAKGSEFPSMACAIEIVDRSNKLGLVSLKDGRFLAYSIETGEIMDSDQCLRLTP
ncbi:MAG: hypothetical protein LBF93_06800 [Zoogloeaceae bacterium]|nr:hypothetical protein [Zoogloeaceae bacterium]